MIVKTRNNKRSWNYYEGDVVRMFEENSTNEDLPEGTVDLICYEEDAKEESIYIELSKAGELSSSLITNQLTYLLNDNGKTIDKLI